MFNKTISNNPFFVISVFFVCTIVSGCGLVSLNSGEAANNRKKDFSKRFKKPKIVGKINSREITESSGLVASRCNKNVFWTHNDSGNGAFVYALNKKGKKLGTWKVTDAKNVDWEDIAIIKDKNGKCFLYIGDIGNNTRSRGTFIIYKVKEPKVSKIDKTSSEKKPQTTEKAESIKFKYPNTRRNSETLMIHPKTEDIYIFSKRYTGASGVYKLLAKTSSGINTLKKVADLSLPALPNGLLTGGEISSDGKRIILCDYFNAYELVLPKDANSFDEIWKNDSSIIELGKREQGEAICYSIDMNSIFATSEKRNSPFIEVERK